MTSKADQSRLDLIHSMPCICCVIWNEERAKRGLPAVQQPNPTQAHHIVDNGYRRLSGNHQSTLPLCMWHHMGIPLFGWKSSGMELVYGPSMADRKRAFILDFGMERVLLDRVNKEILTKVDLPSKSTSVE